MEKPDIKLLITQANNLKDNITNKLILADMHIMNPRRGEKDEPDFITMKKFNQEVLKKYKDGLIGDDDTCESLLFAFNDIEQQVNIQVERLRDYWRKVAEAMQIMLNYISHLEKKNKSLASYRTRWKSIESDMNKFEEKKKSYLERTDLLDKVVRDFNAEFALMLKKDADINKIKRDMEILLDSLLRNNRLTLDKSFIEDPPPPLPANKRFGRPI